MWVFVSWLFLTTVIIWFPRSAVICHDSLYIGHPRACLIVLYYPFGRSCFSQAKIKRVPLIGVAMPAICEICYLELSDSPDDPVRVFGCMHTFHAYCIDSWAKGSGKDMKALPCPKCRFTQDVASAKAALCDLTGAASAGAPSVDLAGAASAGAPSVATANTDLLVELAAMDGTDSPASDATEEAEPPAKRRRTAARVTVVDAEAETPDALMSEADTAAEAAANPAAMANTGETASTSSGAAEEGPVRPVPAAKRQRVTSFDAGASEAHKYMDNIYIYMYIYIYTYVYMFINMNVHM